MTLIIPGEREDMHRVGRCQQRDIAEEITVFGQFPRLENVAGNFVDAVVLHQSIRDFVAVQKADEFLYFLFLLFVLGQSRRQREREDREQAAEQHLAKHRTLLLGSSSACRVGSFLRQATAGDV